MSLPAAGWVSLLPAAQTLGGSLLILVPNTFACPWPECKMLGERKGRSR